MLQHGIPALLFLLLPPDIDKFRQGGNWGFSLFLTQKPEVNHKTSGFSFSICSVGLPHHLLRMTA